MFVHNDLKFNISIRSKILWRLYFFLNSSKKRGPQKKRPVNWVMMWTQTHDFHHHLWTGLSRFCFSHCISPWIRTDLAPGMKTLTRYICLKISFSVFSLSSQPLFHPAPLPPPLSLSLSFSLSFSLFLMVVVLKMKISCLKLFRCWCNSNWVLSLRG